GGSSSMRLVRLLLDPVGALPRKYSRLRIARRYRPNGIAGLRENTCQSGRWACFTLYEQCNRLDMRGVRKHIDHARGTQLVTSLMHQDTGIACKSGGVAGHIHESARCMLSKAADHFVRAVARG